MRTKIGVIGAGYWGPNLIRNIVENPDADLVGIADLDETRLRHLGRRYPQLPVATRDFRELLDLGLDGVIISTPPQTHFEIASECLAAGLNVMVEKPLTASSAEAARLIRKAGIHQRNLMVGHTFLFNPAVHALKTMIDQGQLGQLRYLDAVRVGLGLFNPVLNVVWDLGPHDISILCYLLDELPVTVAAQGRDCLQPGIEDIAYLNLTFPSGILAHVRLSWLDPSKTRRITAVGDRKMSIYDDVETVEKIRVYDRGVEAVRRTDTFGEFQFSYRSGDIVIPYIDMQEPLKLEVAHFVDVIRGGSNLLTDGVAGLRVVEVIEAAQVSLESGGNPVEIAYSDPFGQLTDVAGFR